MGNRELTGRTGTEALAVHNFAGGLLQRLFVVVISTSVYHTYCTYR